MEKSETGMQMMNKADILENDIPENLLNTLLKDHTTQKNIFWATNNYEHLGKGYEYLSPITTELITGERGYVIMPRVKKNKELQQTRAKNMAEVFTPAWVCNAQNNLVDEAWFGRKEVFNTEITAADGSHSWKVNEEKIVFPEGKTWMDYVRDTRLEITCGEAPYIVSRYDATTGLIIPIEQRIGMLDRKLRVVGENTDTTSEWIHAAVKAYHNTYAYEWQGDNLLLAREAMLLTFVEYHQKKFGKQPLMESINHIADIITWNVWQMDGLKMVIPDSCKNKINPDLFGEIDKSSCPGCKKEMPNKQHTGIYCLIKDWHAKDPKTGKMGKEIRFVDLLK